MIIWILTIFIPQVLAQQKQYQKLSPENKNVSFSHDFIHK